MKPSLLLVDDDPDDLFALKVTLEPLGLDLATASDGEEALRRLLVQDFDLIVMDLMMPNMNGFETAKLIRQRAKTHRTPIIFLSGFEEADVPSLPGYAPVGAEFLRKPVSAEELNAKIKDCLALDAGKEGPSSTAA